MVPSRILRWALHQRIPELDPEFEKSLSVKKSGTDAEFVKGLASATLGGVRREGESLRHLLGAAREDQSVRSRLPGRIANRVKSFLPRREKL